MKPTLITAERARSCLRIAVSLLVVTLLAAAAHAQSAKLIPAWDASDENSVAHIDHTAWQDILNDYLRVHDSGVNRFDYGALKANAGDFAKLASYLASLQSLDPRDYSRAEQKAYWINFYNALTVQVVADAYPVKSIKDISESLLGSFGDFRRALGRRARQGRRSGPDAEQHRTRHPATHLAG